VEKEKDIVCEICKKLVWKAPTEEYDDGVDNFVDGSTLIFSDAKIIIDVGTEEFEWDINKFGKKVSDKGFGFCSEKCFEKWVKNIVIR